MANRFISSVDGSIPVDEANLIDTISLRKFNPLQTQTVKKITKVSESGYPPELSFVEVGETLPVQIFYPIYENYGTYSVELKVQEENIAVPEFTDATFSLISYYCSVEGFAAVKTGATVTISGSPVNVFGDSNFTALMKNGLIESVAPNRFSDVRSLVEWRFPTIKVKTIQHTLILQIQNTYGTGSVVETFTAVQDVHWSYQTALDQFRDLLNRSEF